MYRSFFILWIGTLFLACQAKSPQEKAQVIIDKAFKAHGSKLFDKSSVEFKFRDRNYKSTRMNGKYNYHRFWDSTGVTIHDELTNTGFIRNIGNIQARLDGKKTEDFTNSVNAVFYFFALPFSLNDPGLIKEYLGEVTIKNQKYDKVQISFKLNPGDRLIHDDTYIYWFNKKDHMLDYLAYDYTEPDEKGLRFRAAINRRSVNGLTVQDYINYKPLNDSTSVLKVQNMDMEYENNQLKELSRIVKENVRVVVK